MRFLNLLWALPFVAFLSGYVMVSFFSYKPIQQAPMVVGSNIQDAIKLLSTNHLNARILAEKEDPDLPNGIVISQTPISGQNIKAQQSVYLVVTRRPPKALAPNFYAMKLSDAQKIAKDEGIILKPYYVESLNPINSCIAQNIEPGQEVPAGEISLYISKGITSDRVIPSFKGLEVNKVVAFLKNYNIPVTTRHKNEQIDDHICDSCIVSDQIPQAHTTLDINKLKQIDLII